jgi:hypothetical protein
LTRDHRETSSAIQQRVAKIEETLVRAQHDLRNQILDQAKSFLDELHHTREELAATLDRELGEIEPETATAEERGPRASQEAEHARP